MEEKKRSYVKDILFLLGGIGTLASGVAGFIYLKDLIQDSHKKDTIEVVDTYLEDNLDSILKTKSSTIVHNEVDIYLREHPDGLINALSVKSHVEKDKVVDVMGQLIKWNKDNKIVGLRVYENGVIKYIHVDGHIYRAFKDTSGYFYFVNNRGRKEWTK